MSLKNRNNIFLITVFGILLFLGGLGVDFHPKALILNFVVLTGLFFKFTFVDRQKIKVPSNFIYYCLFILFAISTIFSNSFSTKTFEAILLYIVGGQYLVFFYNLDRNKGVEIVKNLTVIFITLFSIFFLLNLFTSGFPHMGLSLFATEPAYKNHNYIGDLWAIGVVYLVSRSFDLKKRGGILVNYAFLLLGILFVLLSESRSAVVSILAGFIYLLYYKQKKTTKNSLYLVVFSLCLIFLVSGINKSLLLDRPYYLQAMLSFLHNPLGVGVGNFIEVSKTYGPITGADNTYFAETAHNIILEQLSALGILSFAFFIWIYVVFKEIIKNFRHADPYVGMVFVVLGVNFLFTEAYFIPTLYLLWTAGIGLLLKESKTN